jgi:hypothetical protein
MSDKHTDRQHCDLISLTFIFKESRVKIVINLQGKVPRAGDKPSNVSGWGAANLFVSFDAYGIITNGSPKSNSVASHDNMV